MKITGKGQVAIPQEIRIRLGTLPHTKVEFELGDDYARIRKAADDTRGRSLVEILRGTADIRITTDEIMTLTRGESRKRRK